MQANPRARLSQLTAAARSLSRFQIAAVVVLAVLLAAGTCLAYTRSRPRQVVLKAGVGEGSAPEERMLTVHVAGAVMSPGLYRVPEGSRVADAIAGAGGAAPDAVTDDLNLAARLADGQKVTVPRRAPQQSTPAGAPPSTTGASSLININTADAAELDKLPGVGPAMSARIVEHRKKNGPFSSVDELDNVQGIGPSKLESLRDLVTI